MHCLTQISNSKGGSSAKSDIDLKIGGFHLVGSLQVRASRGAVVIVLCCGSAKKNNTWPLFGPSGASRCLRRFLPLRCVVLDCNRLLSESGMLALLFVSFDQVWAAGSGQDMPCGSARGGAVGLGSALALASAQAPLMEWGWAAHMALVRRTGGSGGWHVESPGSPPLEMKQDRARPVRSPHDWRALWMCWLIGAGGHTCARGSPSAPEWAYRCFMDLFEICSFESLLTLIMDWSDSTTYRQHFESHCGCTVSWKNINTVGQNTKFYWNWP